jgi:hypothetical protein
MRRGFACGRAMGQDQEKTWTGRVLERKSRVSPWILTMATPLNPRVYASVSANGHTPSRSPGRALLAKAPIGVFAACPHIPFALPDTRATRTRTPSLQTPSVAIDPIRP